MGGERRRTVEMKNKKHFDRSEDDWWSWS